MEFHLFPIITFVMLVLVAKNAALPPELYWKSMLPTTPMPKAITDLLFPDQNSSPMDWREEKGTSVGVGKGGVAVNTGKRGKPVYVGVGYGYSPFVYNYAATKTQLHDDPNVALFFLEKDLHQGTKLDLHFIKTSNVATFLPHEVANSIPFSSYQMNLILSKFSIKPDSEEAQIMKNTINECEEPSIRGEEKRCVTSLESMVDFTTSKLGKNVEAVSTQVKKESELQQYTIAKGLRKLGENKAVVCHKQNYPYAVFFCHKLDTTKAYSVPLEGVDGSRVKAIAVCHTDTSKWNPKHLAFQVLKVQPGTAPVCHFLPEDHVVFVPK